MNIINDEYKGVKYLITQEAIDDLKKFHNIDAIREIEMGIEKELQTISTEDHIKTCEISCTDEYDQKTGYYELSKDELNKSLLVMQECIDTMNDLENRITKLYCN